jgi:hypothetical protein
MPTTNRGWYLWVFESATTGKGTTSVVPQKGLKKTGFSR